MSISSITEPQLATPAYNDLFFIAESTNKNNNGFRYLADLYVNNVLLHSYRIFPTESNYGKLNCSKIVSSYLSSQSEITDNIYDGQGVSYEEIKVVWGEEYYSDAWDFADYSAATSTNWTNFSDLSYNPDGLPKTMIYNSVATSVPYSQGDYIRITQTTVNRQEIEGVFRVLDTEYVNSGSVEYMLVLDLAWIGTGTSTSGSVAYANNEKTQNLTQLTSTVITAFNGVLPFETFKDWDYEVYKLTDDTSKFLTNAPIGYVVRPESVVYLSVLDTDNLLDEISFGNGVSTTSYGVTTSDNVVSVNASPSKFFSGGNYSFWCEFMSVQVSESFSFVIDTNCYTYEDIEIIFLDRLGSIFPFQFTRADTDIAVKREVSKKDVTTNEMYDYSLLDNGEEIYSIEEDKTITLETVRLNTSMSEYFKELVSSGWTAIRFGSGEYVRCNIDTSSYKLKDSFTDGMKTYELKIKYSNKDIINW